MHISSFKKQSHYIFLLIKNASPVCVREELAGAYEGKAKDGKVVDQGLGAMPKAKLEAMLSGAI